MRRISVLEEQLGEVEGRARERAESATQERKLEREREQGRHRENLRQLEHSLNSRERMYKERIQGLEDQVEARASR